MDTSCKVCNSAKGSQHSYYGATQICPSCRGFFMRSVQSGLHPYFVCNLKLDRICIVDSKSRQSCKKCRFKKCLDSGMQVKYVHERFERCQKILAQKADGPPKSLARLPFSQDDLKHVDGLFENFFEVKIKNAYKFYAVQTDKIATHGKLFMENRALTYQEVRDNEEMGIFAMSAPILGLIKSEGVDHGGDATLLFKQALFKVHTLYLSACVTDKRFLMSKFLTYGLQHIDNDSIRPVVSQMIAMDPKKYKEKDWSGYYDRIYASPWASEFSLEERHRQIFDEIHVWLQKQNKSDENHNSNDENVEDVETSNMDTNLFILLALVIVFSTDGIRPDLKDPEKIETIQAKYADLLWRYLKAKMPSKATSEFHKGLLFLSTTEEAHHISQKRLAL